MSNNISTLNQDKIKILVDKFGLSVVELDWVVNNLSPAGPKTFELFGNRKITKFLDFCEHMTEAVELEALKTWLKIPNPAFLNISPIDAAALGEWDLLDQCYWQISGGVGA